MSTDIETNRCGIPNRPITVPGDPNFNSSILTAKSALTGIQLHWTYPNVNPQNVAHTLIYRSQVPDESRAQYLETRGGGFHLDEANVEVGTRYYYWIRMVSTTGTTGPFIGPASAVMQPTVESLIDTLVGEVNESSLTVKLREKIDRITDVSSALSTEEQKRLFGDDVLSQLLAGLEEELGRVGVLIFEETTSRITENSALVANINFILAKVDENRAAISQERVVFTNEITALALQIDTLQVTQDEQAGSIQTYQEVLLNQGEDIVQLKAQYVIKLDVNGYVSGFGQSNDGRVSEFTVIANRFAIAQPAKVGSDPDVPLVVPFVIGEVNGETQIALNARALIPDATITNAMVENFIVSNDYDYRKEGWGIFKDFFGSGPYAEFNNVYARGDIEATSIKADTLDVVDTLMIRDNAVTIMAAKSGSEDVRLVGTQGLLTIFVNFGKVAPQQVLVMGSVVLTPNDNGSGSKVLVADLYGPGGRAKSPLAVEQGKESALFVQGTFNPPNKDSSGNYTATYGLQVTAIESGKWDADSYTINVIGAKR